jgi:hypothetical protein
LRAIDGVRPAGEDIIDRLLEAVVQGSASAGRTGNAQEQYQCEAPAPVQHHCRTLSQQSGF